MLDDFKPDDISSGNDGTKRASHSRLNVLANIPRFFRDLWEANRRLFFLVVTIRILRAVLPLQLLLLTKRAIDVVTLHLRHGSFVCTDAYAISCYEKLPWHTLAYIFLNVAATLILARLSWYFEQWLSSLYQQALSLRLIDHAWKLPLESIESPAIRDSLERARRQIASRMSVLSQSLSELQGLITLSAYGVGVALFAPLAALIILVTWIPLAFTDLRFNEENYAEEKRRSPQRKYLDYLRATSTSAGTAKEVKNFRLEAHLRRTYEELSGRLRRQELRSNSSRIVLMSLSGACGAASLFLGYSMAISYAYSGTITIGGFTFLAMGILRIVRQLQTSSSGLSQLAGHALYLDDLYDFLDSEATSPSQKGSKPFPTPITRGIELKDVCFRYPCGQTNVLTEVNFVAKPGEVVAIVGPNGAGKSTLVKLLTRLYDPTDGSICVDDTPIEQYTLSELRKNVVAVFQDFVRYPLRVADNVAFGNVDIKGEEQRIVLATKMATADSFIRSLPDQHRQIVGHLFDNGSDLSGGEWQKLALARAHMSNAQIFIFDEPTASLDAKSEREVLQKIRDLAVLSSCIVILISHRMSSVRSADRIFVMRGGRVVQNGTHEELIGIEGQYSELHGAQSRKQEKEAAESR